MVVRFFMLQTHYRSTLDFSNEALQASEKGFEKLMNAVNTLEKLKTSDKSSSDIISVTAKCYDAMNDDFNAPQAIAVLFELSKELNASLSLDAKFSADSLQAVLQLFQELGDHILGIIQVTIQYTIVPQTGSLTFTGNPVESQKGVTFEAQLVNLLIQIRNEARKQKLFSLSGIIRDGLKRIGIVLEDKKDETVWKRVE